MIWKQALWSKIMLFTKDYHFYGKHANAVKQLTAQFDKEHKIFETNMAVYKLAAIVGFLYNRKANLDNTKTDGQVSETRIFAEKMIKERNNLEFTYRLIMLLDKDYEPDLDKRVNKAFRDYANEPQEDIERFEQYVRGGVEVLHEKIYVPSTQPEDYINNLYDLILDVESHWHDRISSENILELCHANM